ncbi:MAG: hypothetical protein DKM50_03055 [Candidatus Margulisiibacteriota bacterium]|nr:MAG: hypothetical protein A2X43_09840 [Candidatus Margulisbacteria bacterium GWD2_39_127]OGI04576.1 MAG: hypothetical protein A2X42_07690 [Candidatus Margulisbacteria bacterium GWF2_38_17]OGI11892.1 MAG: hypothetical protein A2X41_11580 [Candidatus Margulisbacteria bacterium GWE2_39_32]PZM83096.1 MAG: hypothetical protein DKM50_03055 [Candidatus Margulisiibacteriota bacterium]HAR62237.1 hypothetical protein [Candidatus Margulisiibacteriota bacterium]
MAEKKGTDIKSIITKLKKFYSGKNIILLGIWFISWFFLSLILISPYISKGLNLKVGERSNVQVVSPQYFEIQTRANKKETEQLRELKASQVKDVYSINQEVNQDVNLNVTNFFKALREYRIDEKKLIKPVLNASLTKSYFSRLSKSNDQQFEVISDTVNRIIDKITNRGVSDINDEEIQIIISNELKKNQSLRAYKEVLTDLVKNFLIPNIFYDEQKTNELKKVARNSISPIVTAYRKGEPILYAGDIVNQDHYNVLKYLGYVGVSANYNKIFSLSMLVFMLLFLIERFLYFFKKTIAAEVKYVLLINLFLVGCLFSAKLVSLIPSFNLKFLISFNPIPEPQFVSFMALFIMLLVVLVNREVALFVGFIASLLVGVVFASVSVAIYNSIIAAFAVFNVSNVYERKNLTKAGFNVGVISILATLVLYENHNPQNIFFTLLGGFLVSTVSAIITIGIIPYFESIFGISTSMLYIELSNPNHPLLRRLMMEAPGTYHHSTVVASLAESATEAIGGNYLLARVGSYYHDIGKLKRPYFFVENQIHDENPHQKLSPRLSAIIILSHTKDGAEVAKEYHLPVDIINIIERHHGDSLVYYFYQKYIQKENVEVVSEEQFRYSGPKPQSKEAAIIMLADTIEAAVRSMDKPSPPKIEGMVKKLIKEKIDDGQLNVSALSLSEIEKIKNSIIKTLIGIYHSRIDYSPEKIVQELEGKKKDD